MSRKPILITGCQRSGTTLMSLILDSHPEIFNIDEYKFEYFAINTYLHGNLFTNSSVGQGMKNFHRKKSN